VCHNRAEEAFCKAGRKYLSMRHAYFTHFVQGHAWQKKSCKTEMMPDVILFHPPQLVHCLFGHTHTHFMWRDGESRERTARHAKWDGSYSGLAVLTMPGVSPCQRGLLRRLGLEFNRSGWCFQGASLGSILGPPVQTVRRSAMTLTMEPGPAMSTSCRLLVHGCQVMGATRGLYLLVPAEQDTHSLATTLASASAVNLGETGRLRGDVAGAACWSRLCHAFVATRE
jgi:hypothetical protein